MFPSARESGGLDRENIHAVLVLIAFLGQERRGREGTVNRRRKLLLALDRCYVDMTVMTGLVFGEIGVSLPVGTQPLYVYLLDRHRTDSLKPLALAEHLAVLGDIRTAGEDHIRRRFAYARRSIDVSAMHARTLLGDHLAAESVLPYQTVTARQIEDDLCSLNSQLRRRRQRRPQVLAYLYTKGVISGGENQVCTEWHLSAPYLYLRNPRFYSTRFVFACSTTGCEPAFLVELARVRQVDFRHYAHHFAVGHDENAVE